VDTTTTIWTSCFVELRVESLNCLNCRLEWWWLYFSPLVVTNPLWDWYKVKNARVSMQSRFCRNKFWNEIPLSSYFILILFSQFPSLVYSAFAFACATYFHPKNAVLSVQNLLYLSSTQSVIAGPRICNNELFPDTFRRMHTEENVKTLSDSNVCISFL